MSVNLSDQLLRQRLLVLTLGESHHANWWPSQFLSPTGLSMLRHLYPHNYFGAAVRSAQRAAQMVHDKDLGVAWAFHLMRLPPELESQLEKQLRQHEPALRAEFQPLLTDRAALLAELEKLGGVTFKKLPTGLWRLGLAHTQTWEHWARQFASAYSSAFTNNTRVFPFVEMEAEAA